MRSLTQSAVRPLRVNGKELSFLFRFRRLMIAVCEHKFFDYIILLFILISCVVLTLEEPHIPPTSKVINLLILEFCFAQ